MKGVNYIKDKKNKRKAVVIDIDAMKNHEEEIHELIDVLIAESRVEEPTVEWKVAKKKLKRKGKL